MNLVILTHNVLLLGSGIDNFQNFGSLGSGIPNVLLLVWTFNIIKFKFTFSKKVSNSWKVPMASLAQN